MAEVITILGVASSVVQLVDSVAKLKGVCSAYKDASADLADLVFEISISAKHLDKSREHFEKASLLDCGLVSDCLDYLQQALGSINVVSTEMRNAFTCHKRIGAVKFAWKSDQIQKLRQKLERAQKLLDRTERLMDRAEREITASEQSRQLQAIRFSSELLAQAFRETQSAKKSSPDEHQASKMVTLPVTPQLAFEALKLTPMTDLKRISKASEYKIALPRWLWSKALDVVIKRQASSLTCSLRYYNILPHDSEAVGVVLDGGVERMKDLLSSGKVTPFDIRCDGSSLLGLAIFRCYPDMSRLLIGQGAEIDSADRICELVWFFAFGLYCGPRGEGHQLFKQNTSELFDLFTSLALCGDPLDEDDEEVDHQQSIYLSRLVQVGGLSRAKLLPPKERAKMILDCGSPYLMEGLLGPDLSLRQALVYANENSLRHRGLLSKILQKNREERNVWSDIYRELIAFDRSLDLHILGLTQDPYRSMGILVSSCSRNIGQSRPFNELVKDMPTTVNCQMQDLLCYMSDLGTDLEYLGEIELQLERLFFFDHIHWRSVTHLNTGPSPTDWRIWLAPKDWEYEWAGEFWYGVGNPEMYIPGAFMDEDYW